MNAAGIKIELKNVRLYILRASLDVVTKILTVLEFDKLQAFVDNIAKSVEGPNDGQFCHNIDKD